MPLVTSPPDTSDPPSGGRDQQDLVFAESLLINDDGTLIQTSAVHLGRAGGVSWSREMPVVVKGSPLRFAIENCRTVRLSKPEKYRQHGETLISDPDEGMTRHEESSETVRVDDPEDLSRAAEFDDELNRGAAAIGSKRRMTVTSTKTTDRNSTKTTHTYGKNGWVWCAAVEPENQQQWDAWQESLGDDYDCVTTIRSPREFARQLALMAAQQIGPCGSPATFTHPYTKHETKHPSVSVFHGAVAYVDDPHAYVSDAVESFERMLRAVFFKHTKYADQREYRFVIWTAAEPEEVVVNLQATPELLAQVSTTPIGSGEAYANAQAAPLVEHNRSVKQADGADATFPAPNDETTERAAGSPPEASDHERSTSQPIHVVVSPGDGLQSAIAARFAAVLETFRQAALDEGVPADLCAAAFHLEWIVMRLLLTFVDPIEGFTWTDGVFVVTLKAPPGSNATAQMSVGPNGTAQYKTTTDDGYEEVSCKDSFLIADTLIDDLDRLGLFRCAQAVAEGRVPPQPSIALQETERVDKRTTRSAPIHRVTVRNAQDLSEADVDAINAEEEQRPDDARITKLIIDCGPGGTGRMLGVRQGLTGTIRQRVRHDYVAFRVETMNPNATVAIDHPDSAPDLDGHTVALPDGEDTAITVTATSPDGTSQSQMKYIALRTAEEEQEAA